MIPFIDEIEKVNQQVVEKYSPDKIIPTLRYREWFLAGDKDLNGARILYEHDADYGIVMFHLQQCIEKYFKGFLISKTGLLQNGHSLIKLCKKSS